MYCVVLCCVFHCVLVVSFVLFVLCWCVVSFLCVLIRVPVLLFCSVVVSRYVFGLFVFL